MSFHLTPSLDFQDGISHQPASRIRGSRSRLYRFLVGLGDGLGDGEGDGLDASGWIVSW